MNELTEFAKKLEKSPQAGGIKAAANSAEAKRVASSLDAAAVERAAKNGDAAALKGILSQVLSTPDGQALAKKIQDAMKQHQ